MEVVVRFDHDGPLGIGFEQVQDLHTGALHVTIKNVRENSAASQHPELRAGLLLQYINGEPQDTRQWEDVVAQLVERPIELCRAA